MIETSSEFLVPYDFTLKEGGLCDDRNNYRPTILRSPTAAALKAIAVKCNLFGGLAVCAKKNL